VTARGRAWIRVAEWVAGLVVVGFLGVLLVRDWSQVQAHHWSVDWPRVVLSSACVVVAYSGFVLAWRIALARLGGHLSLVDAHRVWYLGNFGRYVPGKVLQLAGTAYFARAKGVSPVLAVSASLAAQLFVLGAGILVAGAAAPSLDRPGLAAYRTVGMAAAVAFLAIVLTPLLGVAYRAGLRLIGRSEYYTPLPWSERLVLLVVNLGAWIVLGVGFWLFLGGVTDLPGDAFLPAVGICAAGYVAGYLAVFVPGGLGVREGVYAALLSLYIPPSVSVAVAILARLWMTACEVVAAGLLVARYGIGDLRAAQPSTPVDHG